MVATVDDVMVLVETYVGACIFYEGRDAERTRDALKTAIEELIADATHYRSLCGKTDGPQSS